MNRNPSAPCQTSMNTGMAWSIMSEIAQLLGVLAERDQVSAIDLRSLPMTASDLAQLEELLGRGEITAHLDLAGKSEIWETQYPGVWWIRHMGAEDKVACEEIAITRLPEILMTHPVDVQAAAVRIRSELDANPPGSRDLEQEATNV